jgi:uncharacterized repeat protein (TIGR01451 family)
VKLSHRLATAAAVTVALATFTPAHAVTIPSGPAGSADAYGLLVDTELVNTSVPVVFGPRARATQDYPPGATSPAEANELAAGPLPADSSLVDHVGVMDSIAGANGLPNAVASASVADVSLLGAGNNAKITADLLVAQANTDCVNAPNATGTQFVNLVVNGTPVSNTPAPNTTILIPPVGPTVAIVIVNEQVPANDGRGIVVNALHVVSTTAGDPLFRGDVIVSHAMSTVHCTNGAGSTGSTNTVTMTKSATPSTAMAGDTVTYDAAVTNHGSTACLVNAFVEHLSPAFDFTATSGDFGTSLDKTLARPGGGNDLYLGNGKTLAAGATFHQQFVVTVKSGTAPGVYYNNLELLCANIGEFVKGLDAPVRVVDEVTPVDDTPKPQCSDGKDNDGDGKVDFGTDPGCTSLQDDDERDTASQLPRTGGGDAFFLLGGTVLIALAAGTRRLRTYV